MSALSKRRISSGRFFQANKFAQKVSFSHQRQIAGRSHAEGVSQPLPATSKGLSIGGTSKEVSIGGFQVVKSLQQAPLGCRWYLSNQEDLLSLTIPVDLIFRG